MVITNPHTNRTTSGGQAWLRCTGDATHHSCKQLSCTCFGKLGLLFVGVLLIRALLFVVSIRAPDFWKLQDRNLSMGFGTSKVPCVSSYVPLARSSLLLEGFEVWALGSYAVVGVLYRYSGVGVRT